MESTVKRRSAISKGTERICSHNVEWILEGKGLYLGDVDILHIQDCLIDNYVSGELCTLTPKGKEVWGWWNIQF